MVLTHSGSYALLYNKYEFPFKRQACRRRLIKFKLIYFFGKYGMQSFLAKFANMTTLLVTKFINYICRQIQVDFERFNYGN